LVIALLVWLSLVFNRATAHTIMIPQWRSGSYCACAVVEVLQGAQSGFVTGFHVTLQGFRLRAR
jgi:hypothetical protein